LNKSNMLVCMMKFPLLKDTAGVWLALFMPVVGLAQLIAPGTALPLNSNPPVIFLNGYQQSCPGSFSNTFGIADQVLAGVGRNSVFFDNCTVAGRPAIEDLGKAFGTFLTGLRYTDGTSVPMVDVVAHSMGGLIVRSYLSGKQTGGAVFQPPVAPLIRKAVFIATPHFGSGLGILFGSYTQSKDLGSGSHFLFDLGTWNQGTDDLRGVDALALAGNAGSEVMSGFDDGVVALTSAAIGFAESGRTRVVPYCHIEGSGIIGIAGFCPFSAPAIARFTSATQDTARALISFLAGTTDWQSIGTAAEQDKFLSVDGGLIVTVHGADDSSVTPNTVTAMGPTLTKNLNIPSSSTPVAYTDLFPGGPLTLTAGAVSNMLTLPSGYVDAITIKPGPKIARVYPAASAVFPLSVAAGEIVSVYGTLLAAGTAQATMQPLPTQLSDAQVLVNGVAVPLFYVSASQINALSPASSTGLVALTVTNGAGKHTVNVLIEATVPAVFTQNSGGTGQAAALDASNAPVSAANPLRAGAYVELFATGLNSVTPTVTAGGMNCAVSFAGQAPGFAGLDQINCQLPAHLIGAAVPVVVQAGARASNAVTLPIVP
jgi:uncharacterized protein (TIGR03437 family)